jgi:broad specificity phosphatase PhoE
MAVIYLIRHGQASFAASDYDQLSPLGSEQAALAGSALRVRGVKPDVILSGGMRRHHQTATACLGALGLQAAWDEDRGWDEYDHNEVLGGLEARFRSQAEIAAELARHVDPKRAFQQLFDRAVERWLDAAYHAEYQESWPAFYERVEQALARTRARLARSGTALVFTSGGAISVVCRALLGLSDKRTLLLSQSIANGSLTKLVCGERGITLSTLNEHAHLEVERRLISYR